MAYTLTYCRARNSASCPETGADGLLTTQSGRYRDQKHPNLKAGSAKAGGCRRSRACAVIGVFGAKHGLYYLLHTQEMSRNAATI